MLKWWGGVAARVCLTERFRFAFSGNKIEIKNHYRGHKLSMWLSLIPQLHMPGDLTELAMRHHHFAETDKRFYDGKCVTLCPKVAQANERTFEPLRKKRPKKNKLKIDSNVIALPLSLFRIGAVRDQTVLMPTKTKPKPVPPAPPPTAQSKSTEIIVVHTSTTGNLDQSE